MTRAREYWGALSGTLLALAGMVTLCVSGCGSLVSASAKDRVSVSVHGVNHTGNEFTYVLIDPANPANTAGGELVEPFATGGTMCCFDLPTKWEPGIRMLIKTTNFLATDTDKSLSEVRNTYSAEVPPYVDGKAGELWVIRTAAGDVELVSSDFQPDHASWPGKVKGWPVPTLEYRRSRWEIYVQSEQMHVTNYKELLARLENIPEEASKVAWEHDMKYRGNQVKQFTGPSDPKYSTYLKSRYQAGLAGAIERLRAVEAQKP